MDLYVPVCEKSLARWGVLLAEKLFFQQGISCPSENRGLRRRTFPKGGVSPLLYITVFERSVSLSTDFFAPGVEDDVGDLPCRVILPGPELLVGFGVVFA